MLQQTIPFEEPQNRLITRGVKPVRVEYADENEWLELRGHGIGGSDIGAVVGFNKYRTALDVWLEKTGQVAPVDLSKNNAVRLGKKLEPIVIELYEEDRGEKVHRVHAILSRHDHPWMRCSLDGRIVGKPWIIEAKTVGFWAHRLGDWGDEDNTDAVPLPYMAQAQWNMAVSDAVRCIVPVLVAGQEPRYYTIERDDELIDMLFARGHDVWDRVEIAIPLVERIRELESSERRPISEIDKLRCKLLEIAPASQTIEDVTKKWPMEIEGKKIEATPEIYALERELRAVGAAKKQAEDRYEDLKLSIGEYMQDAEILTYGNEPIRTYKFQATQRLDGGRLKVEQPEIYAAYTYESQSRVLREKNPPKAKKGKIAA